uniref:hypothetical protein n=1 Tax=Tessaracoccus coleopterorum TaxID=2714950 RepID=UPI001E600BDB|nr:hypothetical protein [Tessaracoccus coleopterorum]
MVVDDLDITYRVSLERKNSLKNALVRKARKEEVRYREVKAIRNVSFEVPAGQCTDSSVPTARASRP